MNLIYLGKVVNTHGIKGEIRIISNFKYKKDVFKPNNFIYINDTKYLINSYRVHKMYDMVTLDGITNINDAQNLKGLNVYISRDDYSFDGILNEDLIGLDVYDKDVFKGKVLEVLTIKDRNLLLIDGKKRHMVPYIPNFIEKIDLKKKRIYIKYIRGLDNED